MATYYRPRRLRRSRDRDWFGMIDDLDKVLRQLLIRELPVKNRETYTARKKR